MPKADLGKVMAGKYSRVKSTWLNKNCVVICLHLRPLVCLIRQMRCALSNYTLNLCPGLEEISGRRMAPTLVLPYRDFLQGPLLLAFPALRPLYLRILRFLAPLGSGFCLLPALPLRPCGVTDCLKSSGMGRSWNLPLFRSHVTQAWLFA